MRSTIVTLEHVLRYLLAVLTALISANAVAATSQLSCDLAKAEACFAQLFDQLPICNAAEHAGELAFRCQHFNVRRVS